MSGSVGLVRRTSGITAAPVPSCRVAAMSAFTRLWLWKEQSLQASLRLDIDRLWQDIAMRSAFIRWSILNLSHLFDCKARQLPLLYPLT
jgi:hypothetical protein